MQCIEHVADVHDGAGIVAIARKVPTRIPATIDHDVVLERDGSWKC